MSTRLRIDTATALTLLGALALTACSRDATSSHAAPPSPSPSAPPSPSSSAPPSPSSSATPAAAPSPGPDAGPQCPVGAPVRLDLAAFEARAARSKPIDRPATAGKKPELGQVFPVWEVLAALGRADEAGALDGRAKSTMDEVFDCRFASRTITMSAGASHRLLTFDCENLSLPEENDGRTFDAFAVLGATDAPDRWCLLGWYASEGSLQARGVDDQGPRFEVRPVELVAPGRVALDVVSRRQSQKYTFGDRVERTLYGIEDGAWRELLQVRYEANDYEDELCGHSWSQSSRLSFGSDFPKTVRVTTTKTCEPPADDAECKRERCRPGETSVLYRMKAGRYVAD